MLALENVLVKPLLTEKTSKMSETQNIYSFVVHSGSTKISIKKAVEKFFDVKVVGVNTTNNPGKTKRSARSHKKTNGFKKAFVKVQDGQKIEFFKGI